MTHTVRILILVHDQSLQQRLLQELGAWAIASSDLTELAQTAGPPQIVVADTWPLPSAADFLGPALRSGEVAVVSLGAEGSADVQLPADWHSRELHLACRLLAEVARLRSEVVEAQRSQESLRKMAFRDPLTGLPNRRWWDRELVCRLDDLHDSDSRAVLGLVLLDVDLFKPVNDQLGMVVGDTVLQRIGQRLAANLAPQHLAARLGGDEFGILLSSVLADDVPQVADLLRRSVQLPSEDGVPVTGPVTSSAGVVVASPRQVYRPNELLAAADRALRKAKADGRDRTVVGTLSVGS